MVVKISDSNVIDLKNSRKVLVASNNSVIYLFVLKLFTDRFAYG